VRGDGVHDASIRDRRTVGASRHRARIRARARAGGRARMLARGAARARASALALASRAMSGASTSTSAPAGRAPSLERWSADLMEVRRRRRGRASARERGFGRRRGRLSWRR